MIPLGIAVIKQPSGQKPCIHRENLASEAPLDCDFRQTGGTENELACGFSMSAVGLRLEVLASKLP